MIKSLIDLPVSAALLRIRCLHAFWDTQVDTLAARIAHYGKSLLYGY
jgi:hypothetical protein